MVASGVGRLPLISAQARSSETLSASRRHARSILGSRGRDARSASRQARSNVSSILFVPKATARRSWQPSITAGQPVPKVSVLTEETAEIAVAVRQCVSRAGGVHHVGESAVPTSAVYFRHALVGSTSRMWGVEIYF